MNFDSFFNLLTMLSGARGLGMRGADLRGRVVSSPFFVSELLRCSDVCAVW